MGCDLLHSEIVERVSYFDHTISFYLMENCEPGFKYAFAILARNAKLVHTFEVMHTGSTLLSEGKKCFPQALIMKRVISKQLRFGRKFGWVRERGRGLAPYQKWFSLYEE